MSIFAAIYFVVFALLLGMIVGSVFFPRPSKYHNGGTIPNKPAAPSNPPPPRENYICHLAPYGSTTAKNQYGFYGVIPPPAPRNPQRVGPIIYFGETVTNGSTWRHKNGNLYRVLFLTNNPPREGHPAGVVYESVREPHTKWSRDLSDWHRSFTRIESPRYRSKTHAMQVAARAGALRVGNVWRNKQGEEWMIRNLRAVAGRGTEVGLALLPCDPACYTAVHVWASDFVRDYEYVREIP